MMGYDYEVIFKKGNSNTVADALSRKSHSQLYAISGVSSDILQRIQRSWLTDPTVVHLIYKAKNSSGSSKYMWHFEQLRRNGKLVVGCD